MVVSDISLKKFNLKLVQPFAYSGITLKYLPYALIIIKTEQGFRGFGEAALAWDITGETQKGALGMLQYIKPLILNSKIECLSDIKEVMQKINRNIYGNPALKCGIEMALMDLLGKFSKKPVYQILNKKNKNLVVPQKVFSFTEQKPEYVIKSISKLKNQGVKIFKFKAGKNAEQELALLKRVYSVYPNLKANLDVNQGWGDAETALSVIKKLEKENFNIVWIEQPIFYSDYRGLADIRKNTSIPIMVDESCHNLLDLKNLYYRNCMDYINIKLSKSGGIFEAQRMIDFCREKDIKYMLGDMLHSQLGTAYNLHFAAIQNLLTIDLTMPGRLKKEPFHGLSFQDYKVVIPKKPGLGVKPS